LLALDRATDECPIVEARDFEVAEVLAEPWQATTLAIIRDLGRTRFQASCDGVLATITARPGIQRRDLFRAHRQLKEREFDEILGALFAQGLAHAAKIDGQRGRAPITYWPGPGT